MFTLRPIRRSKPQHRHTKARRPLVEPLEGRALMAMFHIESGAALFGTLDTGSEHKQGQHPLGGPAVDLPTELKSNGSTSQFGGQVSAISDHEFNIYATEYLKVKSNDAPVTFSQAVTRTGDKYTQRIGFRIVAEEGEKKDEMVKISLTYSYDSAITDRGLVTGSIKLAYAVNDLNRVPMELLNSQVATTTTTPRMTAKIDAKIGDIIYVIAELSPALSSGAANSAAKALCKLDIHGSIPPRFSTNPPIPAAPFEPAPPLPA